MEDRHAEPVVPDLPVAAPDPAAEFKRHYTQVCHCEWSDDEFTRQTTSENCVMHGNAPDPLVAFLVERQQDKERIERLEAIEGAAHKVYFGPSKGSVAVRLWAALAAALAVEEDARPGKPETPGNSGAAVEEDA